MLIVFSTVKLSIIFVWKYIKAAHLLYTCCRSGWLWLRVTCALNFYHGSGHWRWSASVGFSGCRGFAALSDSCPLQARGFAAGCCGGHHRGQLWTGQRSASFYLLFSLCIVSILIGQSKDYVQEVRSVVFVLIVNKKVCSPLLQSVQEYSMLLVLGSYCVGAMQPAYSRWFRSWQQIQQDHDRWVNYSLG